MKVVCDNGIRLIKNSQAQVLRDEEVGISIYNGKQWYIIYDNTLPIGRIRFTIAHELGHIFLNHPLNIGFYTRTTAHQIPRVENEANIFASRFLAPACVIWGINAYNAAEIAQVCEISQQAAKIRAERMALLKPRGKFLCSPLEREVFLQFADFIRQYNNNK